VGYAVAAEHHDHFNSKRRGILELSKKWQGMLPTASMIIRKQLKVCASELLTTVTSC